MTSTKTIGTNANRKKNGAILAMTFLVLLSFFPSAWASPWEATLNHNFGEQKMFVIGSAMTLYFSVENTGEEMLHIYETGMQFEFQEGTGEYWHRDQDEFIKPGQVVDLKPLVVPLTEELTEGTHRYRVGMALHYYDGQQWIDEGFVYVPDYYEIVITGVPYIELVSKSVKPMETEPLYPGDTVEAKWTWKNTGTGAARNFSLEPSIPTGVTLVEATPPKDLAVGATDTWTLKLKPEKDGEFVVIVKAFADNVRPAKFNITLTVSPKGVCIIATATYGSELAPEVQFLRGFRDGTVLSTFAGSHFMAVFDGWYYSFSPSVAGFIAEQPLVRTSTKVALYPLIGILHLSQIAYSLFAFSPELGVVVAGFVASALIGVVYLCPILTVSLEILRRRRGAVLRMRVPSWLVVPWLASVVLMILGEVIGSPVIMMVATGAFVLATLSLSAAMVSVFVVRHLTYTTR